jgi:FMN-dependent oxidoreductase (nitrilotriacetate monooxygenase family)
MTKRKDQIRLGAFLMATGHHVAAWRHPTAQADAGVNLAHYLEIAQTAERALFDMVFLADSQGGFFDRKDKGALGHSAQGATFEPLTLLSAIAAHTRHIGLVATATTTYYEPFILARLFASLDVISGGRAAWNLVTSASPLEAENFGRDRHPEPEDRYDRAEEFFDVVKGLWESWEDDAFLRDKASGRFSDPDKLHILNHAGRHFHVAGPLNVPRSAQGYPVVVQAGSSEPGRALAARTAEAVFTAHQTLESAQAFYTDLKGRMPSFGRDPDTLKVMPGVFPVIGGTEAEARAKYEALGDLIHPDIPRRFLAAVFNDARLNDHPIDDPLPAWLEVDGRASRPALLLELAQREKLTARQLHLRIAGARGHRTIFGTPEGIADQLEEWFDGYGADGFNVMPPLLPGGLTEFAEQVIPILQKRGRFRTEYGGATLRENLGLPFPTHPALAPIAHAAE